MERHFAEYMSDINNATGIAVQTVLDMQDGDVLCLGGRELHFYPEDGYQKEYWISNNDAGVKTIAFPIIGKKNITIDGQGAKLIFHGKVLPFVIDDCENITIQNLSIDYADPMYFAAKVIDSGENFVEMEYDESIFRCDIQDHKLRFWGDHWETITDTMLVNEFESAFKGPMHNTPTYMAYFGKEKCTTFMAPIYRYLTAKKTAHNRLRLAGDIGYRHTVGKHWLCTPHLRECPGIFCNNTKNIYISDLRILHAQSMGVICQICENITLDGVTVKAGDGRLLSSNADATHFVNCSGLIHLNNCIFENMMDDAGNIHGMYLPIVQKQSQNQLLLRFGHYQQKGVNIFKTGDRVRIVNHETLESVQEFTVKNSRLLSPENVLLETEETLPEYIPTGFVVENHSRMPQVHIESCSTGYNRPRGFLLSTNKDALVENCTFYNLNWGISLTGDALDWFESGAGGNVVLRNNRFDNASYAGDPAILTQSRIQKEVGQIFHKSLTVENNYFRTNGKRFLDVAHIGTVVFRGNTFCQDDSLHGGNNLGENGLALRECKNVQIEKV